MNVFNQGDQRYFVDVFGNLQPLGNNVLVNKLGVLTRAGAAAAVAAGSHYTSSSSGMKQTTLRGFKKSKPNSETPSLRGKKRTSEGDVIQQSPPNNTRRISTGEEHMSRSASKGDEVPVIPPPAKIAKIIPDYFSIMLPHYAKLSLAPSNTGSGNHIDVRLNSIYDPIVGVLSNVQPQGRDQWAANFEFYRVLGANVKLTVLTNQPGDITAPPSTDTWVFAYELDEQLGRVSDSVEALMVTKHAKREFISTAPQTMTRS